MNNQDDYLVDYREFFDRFYKSIDPDDQLPLKVCGYFVNEEELVGEIIDLTLQYLNRK